MKIVIVGDALSVGGIDIKKRLAMSYTGQTLSNNMLPVHANGFKRSISIAGSTHTVKVCDVSGIEGNLPVNISELRKPVYENADIVIIALPLYNNDNPFSDLKPDADASADMDAATVQRWWKEIRKEAPAAMPFVLGVRDHDSFKFESGLQAIPEHLKRYVYHDDSGDVFRALNEAVMVFQQLKKDKKQLASTTAIQSDKFPLIQNEEASYVKLNEQFRQAVEVGDAGAVGMLLRDPSLSINTRFIHDNLSTPCIVSAKNTVLPQLLRQGNLFVRERSSRPGVHANFAIDHVDYAASLAYLHSVLLWECRQWLSRPGDTLKQYNDWYTNRQGKITSLSVPQQKQLREILVVHISEELSQYLDNKPKIERLMQEFTKISWQMAIAGFLHAILQLPDGKQRTDLLHQFLLKVVVMLAAADKGKHDATVLLDELIERNGEAVLMPLFIEAYECLDIDDEMQTLISDLDKNTNWADEIIHANISVVALPKDANAKTSLERPSATAAVAEAKLKIAKQGIAQAVKAGGDIDADVAGKLEAWFEHNLDYANHITQATYYTELMRIPFELYFNRARLESYLTQADSIVTLCQFVEAAYSIHREHASFLFWQSRDLKMPGAVRFNDSMPEWSNVDVFEFAVMECALNGYLSTRFDLQSLFADEAGDGSTMAEQLDTALTRIAKHSPRLHAAIVNFPDAFLSLCRIQVNNVDLVAVYLKHGFVFDVDAKVSLSSELFHGSLTNWQLPRTQALFKLILPAEFKQVLASHRCDNQFLPDLRFFFEITSRQRETILDVMPDLFDEIAPSLAAHNLAVFDARLSAHLAKSGPPDRNDTTRADCANAIVKFVSFAAAFMGRPGIAASTLKAALVRCFSGASACPEMARAILYSMKAARGAGIIFAMTKASLSFVMAELAVEHGIVLSPVYSAEDIPYALVEHIPLDASSKLDMTTFLIVLAHLAKCEQSLLRCDTNLGTEARVLDSKRLALMKRSVAAFTGESAALLSGDNQGKAFFAPTQIEGMADAISALTLKLKLPKVFYTIVLSTCWDKAALVAVLHRIDLNAFIQTLPSSTAKYTLIDQLRGHQFSKNKSEAKGWQCDHFTFEDNFWQDIALLSFEQMLTAKLAAIGRYNDIEAFHTSVSRAIANWLFLNLEQYESGSAEAIFVVDKLYPFFLEKLKQFVIDNVNNKNAHALADGFSLLFPTPHFLESACWRKTQRFIRCMLEDIDNVLVNRHFLRAAIQLDVYVAITDVILNVIVRSASPVDTLVKYMTVLANVGDTNNPFFVFKCAEKGGFALSLDDFGHYACCDAETATFKAICAVDMREMFADVSLQPEQLSKVLAVDHYDPNSRNLQLHFIKKMISGFGTYAVGSKKSAFTQKLHGLEGFDDWQRRPQHQHFWVEHEIAGAGFALYFNEDALDVALATKDTRSTCGEFVREAFKFDSRCAMNFFTENRDKGSFLSVDSDFFTDAIRVLAKADFMATQSAIIKRFSHASSTTVTTAQKLDEALVTMDAYRGSAVLAFVNSRDAPHNKARLHYLAEAMSQNDEIAVLLEHGADLTVTDDSGKRPVQLITQDCTHIRSHFQLLLKDLTVFAEKQLDVSPTKLLVDIARDWQAEINFVLPAESVERLLAAAEKGGPTVNDERVEQNVLAGQPGLVAFGEPDDLGSVEQRDIPVSAKFI